jgi:transposase-like protein
MTMAKSQKRWTAEEKLKILKEGQSTGASIAKVFKAPKSKVSL